MVKISQQFLSLQSINTVSRYCAVLFTLLWCSASVSQHFEPIKLLSMHDPFARAWFENTALVHQKLGVPLDVTLMDYESSNRAIAVNAARRESAYDLIAIDIVWMGHYGALNALLPLDQILDSRGVDAAEFISIAWDAGRMNDQQLAVPIQPHPEILIYRRSVLDKLGASPPETTEDVLRLAKRISEEIPGMYGICWNGASGAALGQQMLHFAGAFGGRLIDHQGHFTVNESAWRDALHYAKSLSLWSPPLIRDMAWDQRIEHFRSGICGMSYAWGARTAILEADKSPIAGDIGYLPAPNGIGFPKTTPMGAWLLAIPANLPAERMPTVADAIVKLTSERSAKLLLELGVSTLSRPLPDESYRYPVLKLLQQLNENKQLTLGMRPAIPSFQALSEIIGVESHAAIFGSAKSDKALQSINSRLKELEVTSE